VVVSSIFAAIIVSQFRRDSISRPSYEDISRWQSELIFVQAGGGTVWGFAPWLLWQGGSALNHLCLAGAMVVVLPNFVVSRANHSGVILAGIVPVAALSALRFVLGEG